MQKVFSEKTFSSFFETFISKLVVLFGGDFYDCFTLELGLFEDAGIIEENLKLNSDCGILLYTDGVTEAVNHENKFYGEQRLLNLINNI